MKKIIALLLILAAGSAMRSQTFSISFANQVNPCNRDGSVDALVTGGTAPYTYAWYNTWPYNNMNAIPVATSSSLTNASAGSYYVVVTDANGFTSQSSIYFPSLISAYTTNSMPATCPLNNGSITYQVNGGTPPYNYYWSNGQSFTGQNGASTTLTNLAAGSYTLLVVDANGCVYNNNDTMGYVSGNTSFSVTTSSTSSSCNNGTATASVSGSGTPPYTYYWSTNPPQTTATAIGLSGNEYPYVTVTDANGCNVTRYEYIATTAGALSGYANNGVANCPNTTGTIDLTVNGGTQPYTYLWNTGATTQDLSGVPVGSYSVVVTDNSGCTTTINALVYNGSSINTNITTTPTNCSNNSGTATVAVSGGTAPYTYLWSNGVTTPINTGIGQGYYNVLVTDANGCTNYYSYYGYVGVSQACFNAISGYVYNDMDGNCVADVTETGLPWQVVDIGNGLYTSTNASGQYYYSTLASATYTVSHTPNAAWNPICPVTDYTVTSMPGQITSGSDFYDQPLILQNDIEISVYGGICRPGFNNTKYYTIYNKGTTSLSGTIEIKHDPLETYTGAPNAIAYNAVTRTITLAFSNLAPFNWTNGNLYFTLPSSVPLGTQLTTSGVAYPLAGDYTPDDNHDTSVVVVVGSYDPNMKEVSPKGIGASGLISPVNEDFEYTVHFQNTGNYYAETVVIKDTLDTDLDINTFQLIGSSHNVTWAISGPRVVTFTFNNIYLPDSTSNERGSHGLVSYRIKQKPNLTGGTEIKNTAYIYFDYNAPIVTNTTLNTIEIVGIKENEFNSSIVISPNPAQDRITIANKTKELCSKVEILDINGRVVASIIPTSANIQLPEMSSGVYILNAHYTSGIYKEKLIISK